MRYPSAFVVRRWLPKGSVQRRALTFRARTHRPPDSRSASRARAVSRGALAAAGPGRPCPSRPGSPSWAGGGARGVGGSQGGCSARGARRSGCEIAASGVPPGNFRDPGLFRRAPLHEHACKSLCVFCFLEPVIRKQHRCHQPTYYVCELRESACMLTCIMKCSFTRALPPKGIPRATGKSPVSLALGGSPSAGLCCPHFTLLNLCASSLRRGHANLLCIVPNLTDDPRRESWSAAALTLGGRPSARSGPLLSRTPRRSLTRKRMDLESLLFRLLFLSRVVGAPAWWVPSTMGT